MRRRTEALLAALCVAVLLAALVFTSASHLRHKDALDYAQIAREVASGAGFSSRQAIYALHLRFLAEHDLLAAAWPNLHRFPMQSAVLVPLFLLLGPSFTAVLLTGIGLAAATAAVLYDWARSALGLMPAVATVALFALNGALYFEVAAGIPELATCFFFTLACWLLWHALRRPDLASLAAASGAAMGLAVLSRTNVAAILPVMAFVLWRAERAGRWSRAALLVGAFLLVVAPWAARNVSLAGSPTFSLHSYFLVPSGSVPREPKRDYSIEWVRSFVSPLEYAQRHPGALWDKWSGNVRAFVRAYPWLAGTALVPLLAWLALLRSVGGSLRPVAVVVCVGVVANAALCGLTDMNFARYYYFLVPPMMLLAVCVVWAAAARLPRRSLRVAMLAAATLVLAQPSSLVDAHARVRSRSRPPLPDDVVAAIEQHVPADGVVFSSASHHVTWYTGRKSIRLHYDRAADGARVIAFLVFDDEFGPIDALHLPGTFARHERRGGRLQTLLDDPRFVERFRCLPPLSRGALLCVRRATGRAELQRTRGWTSGDGTA